MFYLSSFVRQSLASSYHAASCEHWTPGFSIFHFYFEDLVHHAGMWTISTSQIVNHFHISDWITDVLYLTRRIMISFLCHTYPFSQSFIYLKSILGFCPALKIILKAENVPLNKRTKILTLNRCIFLYIQKWT